MIVINKINVHEFQLVSYSLRKTSYIPVTKYWFGSKGVFRFWNWFRLYFFNRRSKSCLDLNIPCNWFMGLSEDNFFLYDNLRLSLSVNNFFLDNYFRFWFDYLLPYYNLWFFPWISYHLKTFIFDGVHFLFHIINYLVKMFDIILLGMNDPFQFNYPMLMLVIVYDNSFFHDWLWKDRLRRWLWRFNR